MAEKYYLKETRNMKQEIVTILYMNREAPLKGAQHIATFYNKQLAQKVCDLLNEMSRSQGKYS